MGSYLTNNYPEIVQDLIQHIWLSLLPIIVAIVIAIPVGYLTVRLRPLYQPVIVLCGIIYSIPSLALFVLLPAVLGTKILSPINIVAALTVYTVALLVRTVADALSSVDALVLQSANAMGYTALRRFVSVQLPIAVPTLLAGVRVATVANISLVSVGAIIGVGGLGDLFTRGLQLNFYAPIIVGIVLTLLLAIICDTAIVMAGRMLSPWNRQGAGR